MAGQIGEYGLPHEQIVMREDRATGLKAVIAVHNTTLGPAAGGCRRWTYTSSQAALTDALRLSEGMTYKNALAGIPFGGGKSVILADQNAKPTTAQLKVFAQWLDELKGRYITAEDVGMGLEQLQTLSQFTAHASGLGHRGVGGDPSPKTAYGVFLGLRTAVQIKLGVQNLRGVHVAVQGLGAVGMALCQHLHNAGARLTVADINNQRCQQAKDKFNAQIVGVSEILTTRADVFAPCALGGVITETVAQDIPVNIVAGAANNQLATTQCGDALAQRGVLYAPDFVINAAGVISVAQECLMRQGYFNQCDAQSVQRWVDVRIEGIATRLQNIVGSAQRDGVSTEQAAVRHATNILTSAQASAA